MDAATRRSMLRNALLLGLFALVGVGLVALVQQFTEARIAEAQREARGRALLELLPPGSYDNHPLDSQVPTFAPKLLGLDAPRPAYVARLHGQASAVILQASAPDGYSGAIQLLVGVTAQGRLLGVRVVAHKETPGLGDRIELAKSPWVHGFDGKSLGDPADAGWAVKKDGGTFDQFAGATVTPRAVVRAVHKALRYFDANRERLLAPKRLPDMSEQDFREIARNGLWRTNPGLVQLLGLCPLLGTSNSTVNALGLGLATMLVLACSNAAVSLVRGAVSEAIRLPAFVMIIAVLTTCIELLMQAWTYELYQVLGIFIPLITTNCVILGRAEAFAAKNGVLRASFDGLLMGLGFALVLLVLGGLRELLGQGTLLADMHLLFGPAAADWKIQPFPQYQGFLLAILPPGAFIMLGLLIALKNRIDESLAERAKVQAGDVPATQRQRVRVTGVIE